MSKIAIVARCPEHFNKVIYRTEEEARVYGKLNRIRYGGRVQWPYPCPVTRGHWHNKTNLYRHERKRRRNQWLAENAWENEGGAIR